MPQSIIQRVDYLNDRSLVDATAIVDGAHTCVRTLLDQGQITSRALARGDRTLAEAEHGYRNAGGHLDAHHTFDSTVASAERIAEQLAVHLRGGKSAASPNHAGCHDREP